MKKLFCVLLVMSMLFPLCCANAIDESEYYGTWMQDHYNEETGYYSFEVLRLTPDHRAYFVSQSFSSGEVGLGRQFPTKWEAKNMMGFAFGFGKIRHPICICWMTADWALNLLEMLIPHISG